VDALEGRPGIHSARYAGERATDEETNRKILKSLNGIQNRKAKFVCVITIALPTVPSLTYEGRCDGEITRAPVGKNGFGYDPIFYYRPLNKTFAQMLPEEKNEISHRGRAMAALRRDFERVMMWLHSYGAQR
jgi:XTP/dITP diphosphohydrolase